MSKKDPVILSRIQNSDWMVEENEEGQITLVFTQVLMSDEEENAILAKHGIDCDPGAHHEPKEITLLMIDEDLDDLHKLIEAWRRMKRG